VKSYGVGGSAHIENSLSVFIFLSFLFSVFPKEKQEPFQAIAKKRLKKPF
jgi:hypothetical protein